MVDLPNRGQVATEFRALSGSMSEEIFATIFPSINRVLTEYRENSENMHNETTAGTRTMETSLNLLGSSLNEMNFQLEILKANQKKTLDMLEAMKGKINQEDGASIFDKFIDKIFGGRGAKKTPAGKKGKTAEKNKGKPKTGGTKLDKHPDMPVKPDKSKAKYSIKVFSGLNLLAVAFAIYDAFDRVMSLDPADPEWNKKATKEVSAVITRFGAATVGAIAGSMLGSAVFPGIGSIAGLVAGLIAGLYTDKFFGDDVEEVTKNVIDKLWEMKKNQTATNIPTASNLASLGAPTNDIFTGNAKQNTTQTANYQTAVSVNTGSSIVTASGDDVTVAKDIMFGAKKMKFVGDKLLFTNVTGFAGDKKGKPFKFQTRQQNKTSEKIQELQDKSGQDAGQTSASGSGGVTPQSSVNGTTTPGSGVGGSSGASSYNPTGAGVNVTGSAQEALQFFISKGWTQEQAAGIVGNLMTESNLQTGIVGDGGKAYGIAQWHPDRQRKFQEVYGKPIQQSSFQEQLEFVNWELNNSNKKAGDILRTAKDAAQAAELVDIHYERSKGLHRYQRMNNAVGLMKKQSEQQTPIGPGASATPETTPKNQTASLMDSQPKVSGNELRKTSSEAVSVKVENPEDVKQSLQKVVSINKEYSGPGTYKDSVSAEVVGEGDVSARVRLVQHFSHG